MKATETNFLQFLKAPKQFVIPIYQRTYSWTQAQCLQFWNDIMRAAADESVAGHFIGSVVYIERGLFQITSIPQLLVIDGQQRLTTLTLLLAALGEFSEEHEADITRRKIRNYFLLNIEEDNDLRYKLVLTQSDKDTLMRIVEDRQLPEIRSTRVIDNYRFFRDQIRRSGVDPDTLYEGIGKLSIVDISLDRERDNPQLIFESLNSTGLDLSQADLIRNYVLMGLESKNQERIYNDYWRPMEQSFGQTEYSTLFDRFMRDYLTLKSKSGNIPNIGDVYSSFKSYARGVDDGCIETIVSDVHRYSKHFVKLAFQQEKDKDINQALRDIEQLKVDVAYPFLLEVYEDYEQQRLSREDFLSVLRLVESYVFRRVICGIPTNSHNKTFAALGREVDKSNYLESLQAAFLFKEANRRFPRDEEFWVEFMVKDVYNLKGFRRNYLLRKLENYERPKEKVDVEEYTIEHVMPQNENLSATWRQELGESWKVIRNQYLHTIGNLTLTGYNPEMSDRPFAEKRDMSNGFRDSPIHLNKSLANLTRWNKEEIEKRAEILANMALRVWAFPHLQEQALEEHKRRRVEQEGVPYTLEDHQELQGTTRNLFDQMRKRILNLDASVREEIKKHYIAYKTTTNFVDIEVQKNRLKLFLNVGFDEISDPKNLCRDVTNTGHSGNGDVEVILSSEDHLEDIVALVRQSYLLHEEDGAELVL